MLPSRRAGTTLNFDTRSGMRKHFVGVTTESSLFVPRPHTRIYVDDSATALYFENEDEDEHDMEKGMILFTIQKICHWRGPIFDIGSAFLARPWRISLVADNSLYFIP